MTIEFRVEPVENEDKDDVYFEVQFRRGIDWLPVIRFGVPMCFKKEVMAETEKNKLEHACKMQPPLVN